VTSCREGSQAYRTIGGTARWIAANAVLEKRARCTRSSGCDRILSSWAAVRPPREGRTRCSLSLRAGRGTQRW